MLVLKRNALANGSERAGLGSRVTIEHGDETLTLTVLEVFRHNSGEHSVRIGFEAPKSFRILRDDAGNVTDARLGK